MKTINLFLLMVLTSTYSFCQNKHWEDYLTEEEQIWNEETKDKAYLAPNSKFVGKKWYIGPASYIIFYANGTYKVVSNYQEGFSGHSVIYKATWSGTWKRQKLNFTLTMNPKLTTYTIDKSSLSPFSARKKDEIISLLNELQASERRKRWSPAKFEILKIENDVFLLFDPEYGVPYRGNKGLRYYFSEKKMIEIWNEVQSE